MKELMYQIERAYVSGSSLMYLIERTYVSDLNSCRLRRWPSATFFYKESPCRGLVKSLGLTLMYLNSTLVN